MNSGKLITNALRRSGMAVADWNTRQYALDFLNEICQEYWELTKASFRISTNDFSTVASTDEYSLSKYCSGTHSIVKDTMRGSDPIRRLSFRPSHDFYKHHPYEVPSGDPYEYREGQALGVAIQPSASSQITCVSSFTDLSAGTVSVIYGSKRIVFAGLTLTLDRLGLWIRVGTDDKRYQLSSIENSTTAILAETYEGTTSAAATYALGDVQQKVTVTGFLDTGDLVEEELQLAGSTSVTTVNFFQSLINISKSDVTAGYVTATSNAGLVENAVLDPGETDAVWHTIKVYPIPDKTETIQYEFYMKHPVLYRASDSPLIPSQFHPLLGLELYIRLMTEHLGKSVDKEITKRRDNLRNDFMISAYDTDNWTILQESSEAAESTRTSNLPEMYPNE